MRTLHLIDVMSGKNCLSKLKFALGALLIFRANAAETPATNDPRAAMQASLEKQQAALRQQLNSVRQQIGLSQQLIERAGDFISAFPPLPPAVMARLQPDCPALASEEIEPLVKSAATKQAVDPKLLRAVIKQESGFRPCALSVKGAQGLMQLMPETADQLHVGDAFDPEQNINGGAAYLKQLLVKYNGDLKLTLAAYNAGPKRTDEASAVPKIPETEDYVASILADLAPDKNGPAPSEDKAAKDKDQKQPTPQN